ncbi:DUF1127 domain-containing protein [Cribrihabitans marinus]|nr:DUF1127 domain-containing protein [Cribrihabitans marinus]
MSSQLGITKRENTTMHSPSPNATVSNRTTAARPALFRLRERLSLRLALWRSRRALDKLDARQLRDIGLSRDEARREARKPIWDAPDNWLR